MDSAEKRWLKKLGKRFVEPRSQDLEERRDEANPAPIGSDEWAANYKTGVDRERQLRKAPPDRLSEDEAATKFVLLPVDLGDRFIGVPTWYVQCPLCHDLLHSVPTKPVVCDCGAVQLSMAGDFPILQADATQGIHPRVVRLIGRGTRAKRRSWWRFW